MKKPVRVRFRMDVESVSGAKYEEGQEIELTSPQVADILFGNTVEILRYVDGDPYELAQPEPPKKGKAA